MPFVVYAKNSALAHPGFLHVAEFPVVFFRSLMKRDSSDVFPLLVGIHGIGRIAFLRRDVAEMKLEEFLDFWIRTCF
jgi:hypothetical protein